MKIAVVGGGIYGCTISIILAKNNFDVTLYEKESDIMMAASFVNQYRAHRGYHYPRSYETISSCLRSEESFIEEYGDALIRDNEHYYAIAKKESFVNAKKCSKIWDKFGLEHNEVYLDLMNNENLEKTFKVREYLIDPVRIKDLCRSRLKTNKVKVLLNSEFKEEDLDKFDHVVIAAYALNNSLLKKWPDKLKDYQFELCEKPVLQLPEKYKGKSIVVIDGPFMCIDPFGKSGLFLMGNVEHAIHKRSFGKFPEIPVKFLPLLNKGIINNPPVTNISKFLDAAEEFFPSIKKDAKHIGSMYTIRTVFPNREHDDARPTIVNQINDKITTVFSGKIPVCVKAAQKVLSTLTSKINNDVELSKIAEAQ